MKKSYKIVIITSIIIIVAAISLMVFRFLSSKNQPQYARNPEYTYGEVPEAGIESIFELTGAIRQTAIDSRSIDYNSTEGLHFDSNTSYARVHIVYSSETADGGVVAYDDTVYVYSPDKSKKDGVVTAVLREYLGSLKKPNSNN